MKKILVTLFISFSIIYIVQAQCFDFYVKTPNSSTPNVKACNPTSASMPDWYVADADAYSKTFAITVYENGTRDYNCHAYAWHVKEDGNRVWINNGGFEAGNLNAYLNDNSYVLFTGSGNSHKENVKVFYNSDDHSSITTSNPSVFISKMGCGALVSHLWNNSPYDSSDLTYYARHVITTGSSILCPGPGSPVSVSNARPALHGIKAPISI